MKILAVCIIAVCLIVISLVIFTACHSPKGKNTDSENSENSNLGSDRKPNGSLPAQSAELTYTAADGYVLEQYGGMTNEDYISAADYFTENGYTEYCTSDIGNFVSKTFKGERDYRVISLNSANGELYIGSSRTGANLPYTGVCGEKIKEPTVTQVYSEKINGMSYVVSLADGSFLVVDGGYAKNAAALYRTLCELNGSEENIRIRAWIMSHSHSDHYGAFIQFSKDYAAAVKLDCILYSPVKGSDDEQKYFSTSFASDAARFKGAVLCVVHTGMCFDMGGVRIEILSAPEQIYKNGEDLDFNESSIVFRVKNENGSVLFLADAGINVSRFMLDAYGNALKSDMVQISHHGCETAPSELYDAVAAATCFWPCNQNLLSRNRGELVKQHIINAEYSKEHLLHSYGTVTRALSHKAQAPARLDVMPKGTSGISQSSFVSNMAYDNGILKFDVVNPNNSEQLDPYIYFELDGVDTEAYNAIRIVASSSACTNSSVFFACGSDNTFTAQKECKFGITGASDSGKTTVFGYLANIEGYTGTLNRLRLDFGSAEGETVEI